MIQDIAGRYIGEIVAILSLEGKDVLEIGCGHGRISRDLARHAGRLVAIDPDAAALDAARTAVAAPSATFIHAPDGLPDLPPESFDAVIYSLSLHHVPRADRTASLAAAGRLLRPGGLILVVEPGSGGSFMEAKERFGAGSGDESQAREEAIVAIQEVPGWRVVSIRPFRVDFQFDDLDDFVRHMLPGWQERDGAFRDEVTAFLASRRGTDGIVLDAGRLLFTLSRGGTS